MAKLNTTKTEKPSIKAARKPAMVRDSDLAVLARDFQGVAAKIDELMLSFEERLARVELKLDALVHLIAPPPERAEEREEDARPDGVLHRRVRGSLFNG